MDDDSLLTIAAFHRLSWLMAASLAMEKLVLWLEESRMLTGSSRLNRGCQYLSTWSNHSKDSADLSFKPLPSGLFCSHTLQRVWWLELHFELEINANIITRARFLLLSCFPSRIPTGYPWEVGSVSTKIGYIHELVLDFAVVEICNQRILS